MKILLYLIFKFRSVISMETASKYEEQIINDLRELPAALLPKISKLIHFMKTENIFSGSEKIYFKNKVQFISLEGIFYGKVEHTDDEIRAAQIKLKEI